MELSIDLLTAIWHIFQGSYVEFVGWVDVFNQNKYKNPYFSTSEGPKSAIFVSKWYLVQTPKMTKIEIFRTEIMNKSKSAQAESIQKLLRI